MRRDLVGVLYFAILLGATAAAPVVAARLLELAFPQAREGGEGAAPEGGGILRREDGVQSTTAGGNRAGVRTGPARR